MTKKETAASQEQQQQRTRVGKHKDPTARKRIVVLDDDKVKPESEAYHFLRRLMGKCGRDCIHMETLEDGRKVFRVSEDACPVCVTSAKRCPAVRIVNLPSHLAANATHRYGTNAFVLHGLPMPRPGHVLGLLGCNGIGKSTAIEILSGRLKPNLGVVVDAAGTSLPPTWDDIVRYYRGSDLQNYFRKLAEGTLRFSSKAQLGSSFTRRFEGRTVREVFVAEQEDAIDASRMQRIMDRLELGPLLDRQVQTLSGGERQRLSVGLCANSDADVYLFDEPTAFLDVKQRLAVATVIRDLVHGGSESSKYVIVVEHDLTVLDYVSDYICCLYGEAGAYGVVSQCSTTSKGINQYIAGYLKSENVRFREEALSFRAPATSADGTMRALVDEQHCCRQYSYPAMSKTLGGNTSSTAAVSLFTLSVEAGSFRDGEIVGLLAQNGSGKTTFMDMIAAHFKSDNSIQSISYKRQHLPHIYRTFTGTVEEFLNAHMQWGQTQRMFSILVKNPLKMDSIKDLKVQSLSTGQLQRLTICVCLGTPAQLYLLDEPSAYLDCEMRLVVAKVIKRWVISHLGKPAFVVEHDLVMASALQDRVIVFEGPAGVACTAKSPRMPGDGLNAFLRQLNMTLCLSRESNRPRINKRGSRRDREQKKAGEYFATEDGIVAFDQREL